jgi:hypothetical protein
MRGNLLALKEAQFNILTIKQLNRGEEYPYV